MKERRREERLALQGFSLWLKTPQGALICEVVNISRLGIGLRLPSDASFDHLPVMKPEASFQAILKFMAQRFDIKLRLLRFKGDQIGCAFVFDKVETQQSLFSLLTPRFTASTLIEVPRDSLAPGVKLAFFGQDFGVTSFEDGRGVVFTTLGADCTVSNGAVSIHVESDGSDEGGDGESITRLGDDAGPSRTERDVLSWISGVLEAWETCPDGLRNIFEEAKQKFEAIS